MSYCHGQQGAIPVSVHKLGICPGSWVTEHLTVYMVSTLRAECTEVPKGHAVADSLCKLWAISLLLYKFSTGKQSVWVCTGRQTPPALGASVSWEQDSFMDTGNYRISLEKWTWPNPHPHWTPGEPWLRCWAPCKETMLLSQPCCISGHSARFLSERIEALTLKFPVMVPPSFFSSGIQSQVCYFG